MVGQNCAGLAGTRIVAYRAVRAKRVIVIVLGLLAGVLLALGVTAFVLLPGYIEREAIKEIRARGLELESYTLDYGWRWVKLTAARGHLVGVPAVDLKFETIDVRVAGREPERIDVTGLDVAAQGSAPTLALQLAAWSKRFPATYALPLFAKDVRVVWRPEPAASPWLEIGGGNIAKTPANTVFTAKTMKLAGAPVGQVGASWTSSSSSIAIGLGEKELAQAPIKVGVELGAKPVVLFKLAPSKLESLAKPFNVELPVKDVIATGEVELRFNSQDAPLPADGRAHVELEGWIPPHPVELQGFVFGNVTTFDTRLAVRPDLLLITLTDTKVKAGKFELTGGGTIERDESRALLRLLLRGKLPCPALAGAAAESRLGRLLGATAGKLAGAAARQLVQGSVSVEVKVEGDTSKLADAKIERKIGIGCGLKPLTLEELQKLGELMPSPEELSVLADEIARQGAPGLALPPASALPKLPPLPSNLPPLPRFEIDFGKGKTPKKNAQPAPAASAP
jgi:hypothetical protein